VTRDSAVTLDVGDTTSQTQSYSRIRVIVYNVCVCLENETQVNVCHTNFPSIWHIIHVKKTLSLNNCDSCNVPQKGRKRRRRRNKDKSFTNRKKGHRVGNNRSTDPITTGRMRGNPILHSHVFGASSQCIIQKFPERLRALVPPPDSLLLIPMKAGLCDRASASCDTCVANTPIRAQVS
jgi:hypothetical protein